MASNKLRKKKLTSPSSTPTSSTSDSTEPSSTTSTPELTSTGTLSAEFIYVDDATRAFTSPISISLHTGLESVLDLSRTTSSTSPLAGSFQLPQNLNSENLEFRVTIPGIGAVQFGDTGTPDEVSIYKMWLNDNSVPTTGIAGWRQSFLDNLKHGNTKIEITFLIGSEILSPPTVGASSEGESCSCKVSTTLVLKEDHNQVYSGPVEGLFIMNYDEKDLLKSSVRLVGNTLDGVFNYDESHILGIFLLVRGIGDYATFENSEGAHTLLSIDVDGKSYDVKDWQSALLSACDTSGEKTVNMRIAITLPSDEADVPEQYSEEELREACATTIMTVVYPTAPASKDVGGIILNGDFYKAYNSDLKGNIDKLKRDYYNLKLLATDAEARYINHLHLDYPLKGKEEYYESTKEVTEAASKLADELNALGINMVLSPVLDNSPVGFMSTRAFFNDITAKGLAWISALEAKGIVTTAKHFPGYSTETANSDSTLVDGAYSDTNLVPFDAVKNSVSAIMMNNFRYDGEFAVFHPGLHPQALMKFEGLVISDDLAGNKFNEYSGYSCGDIAIKALEAGTHMMIMMDTGCADEAIAAMFEKAKSDEEFAQKVMAARDKIRAIGY